MSWFYLLLAGSFEIVWALGLKYSDGLRRPVWSALTLVAMAASVWLLALAARQLPIGTAYAVWTGIGALGTVVLGAWLFHEPIGLMRALCLVAVLMGLLGLKLTTAGG